MLYLCSKKCLYCWYAKTFQEFNNKFLVFIRFILVNIKSKGATKSLDHLFFTSIDTYIIETALRISLKGRLTILDRYYWSSDVAAAEAYFLLNMGKHHMVTWL